jgi:probable F420-dependent oxidoreductase
VTFGWLNVAMEIGAIFPQFEIDLDPRSIRLIIEAVRDLGFKHLMAADHVLGVDAASHPGFEGYADLHDPFCDPFVLFAFAASIAPELNLATGVLVLPQRQTALVAKQAADVDNLTQGRLRLGVGVGWNLIEMSAMGVSSRGRGRRFEEQIRLMRELWSKEVVTFSGDFHEFDAVGLNPPPVNGSIPIWIGALSETGVKRAARLADGFIGMSPLNGGWAVTMAILRESLGECGRDPELFGVDLLLSVTRGTALDWRDRVRTWEELGVTHATVQTLRGGLHGAEEHIKLLEQAANALQEYL